MFNRSKNNKYILRSREIDDAVLTMSEGEVSRLESAVSRRYMRFGWYGMILLIGVLGVRVFYLSIIQGDHYQAVAQNNSIRSIPITAPRGKILDRRGKELVHNVPSTDIIIAENELPDDPVAQEELISVLMRIADIPREDIDEAFQLLEDSEQNRAVVKRSILQDEALKILEQGDALPGIILENTVQRKYEESTIFSHVIGYEGKVSQEDLEEYPTYLFTDSIGRMGIEKTYESVLRGQHGEQRAEVDSLGRVKRSIATKNPISGDTITLTIDAQLQKKLYDSLESELSGNELIRGAAVAMDPRNGEVLALISFPSYDNNIFSSNIDRQRYVSLIEDPNKPLFNRAIAGEYPPASTIKPLIAAAALQEGVVSESRQIESKGGIQVGSFYFGDWKIHGFTDIRKALAVSSDVFFYAIGGGYGEVRGLGMDKMKEYEGLFGLGVPTGIALVGEAEGFIPSEQWKQETLDEPWYIGNSYHASIGQGFVSATPIQMAYATAAIANGGTLYEPKLVSYIETQEGTVRTKDTKAHRSGFISPDVLKIVQEGMRLTVTEGTALMLNELSVDVAGKTGTAQYGIEDKTHGWFVSYAPYDEPQIAMAILIEGQENDGYHAVPITGAVYEWYFDQERK